MKPEIILEIDETGEGVLFEVKGEPGKQCLETTRFLEQALGEFVSRRLKTEYHRGRSKSRTGLANVSRIHEPEG